MAETNSGWVKLYHPSGAQVTLPVKEGTPAEMFAFVNELIGTGFAVEQPGMEEGEHKEAASGLVRRVKFNEDGTNTPIIDLYVGDYQYKTLTTYLNRLVDIEEFEQATGLVLADLPVYEGQGSIQLGVNKQLDDKYLVKTSVQFVWKQNPRWTEGSKTVAKRMFVRWANTKSLVEVAEELGGVVVEKKPAMTLDQAKAVISPSYKKTYNELTNEELKTIVENAKKRIADNATPEDQREKFAEYQVAAEMILQSRVG